MTASGQAKGLITRFEGCKLESYQDLKGRWTIGYGETGAHITSGLLITELEAQQWLHNRMNSLSEQITKLVTVKLTQQQFDALVSLAYNVGIGALKHSTLLKKLNSGDYDGAGMEFHKWDHVNGEQVDGLTARRIAEAMLFRS